MPQKLGPALLALALALAVLAAGPARADDELTAQALEMLKQPWTGGLEGMLERRVIRVLTPYNQTDYFLDGPRQRGLMYETVRRFEAELNAKLKTRHLKVHCIFLPTSQDRLLGRLVEGKGDLVAARLTVTPQRAKLVDFTAPLATGVNEVVVAGPEAPPMASLDDLAGRAVTVRRSSSYYESLVRLNNRLRAKGLPPVRIVEADERLETEDLLQMTAAGLIPLTVADGYLARFWAEVLDGLTVYESLAVASGGQIAWAVRQGSGEFLAALNRFVAGAKAGTKLGNILIHRYLRNTRWATNAASADNLERLRGMGELFRRYADRYSFDWLMIAALGYQESRLDQSVVSAAGAVGVMQLLPSTAQGPPVFINDIHKLEPNIHAGNKYLRWLYDTYFKDERGLSHLDRMLLTFAAYNAGPGRVAGLRRKAREMGLSPDHWFGNVEVAAARAIGRETVQYVGNIFKYYLAYRQAQASRQLRRAARDGGPAKP